MSNLFPFLTEPTQIYRFLRTRNLIAVSVAFPSERNQLVEMEPHQ